MEVIKLNLLSLLKEKKTSFEDNLIEFFQENFASHSFLVRCYITLGFILLSAYLVFHCLIKEELNQREYLRKTINHLQYVIKTTKEKSSYIKEDKKTQNLDFHAIFQLLSESLNEHSLHSLTLIPIERESKNIVTCFMKVEGYGNYDEIVRWVYLVLKKNPQISLYEYRVEPKESTDLIKIIVLFRCFIERD